MGKIKNMKRIICIVFLFCSCLGSICAHVHFEGIELTGTKHSFVEQLQRKEYTFVCDNANKSVLEGKYHGFPCSVVVYAYSKSIDIVYRVEVVTNSYTRWDDLSHEYDRIEQRISARYGMPTDATKMIYPPFVEEHNEMLGISLNAFNYHSRWEVDNAIIRISLTSDACIEIRLTDRNSEKMGKKMQQVSVQKAINGTKERIGNILDIFQ